MSPKCQMCTQWLEGRHLTIILPLSHLLGTEWACRIDETKIMAEVKCNKNWLEGGKNESSRQYFSKRKRKKKTFIETYYVLGNMLAAFVFSILSLQPVR